MISWSAQNAVDVTWNFGILSAKGEAFSLATAERVRHTVNQFGLRNRKVGRKALELSKRSFPCLGTYHIYSRVV